MATYRTGLLVVSHSLKLAEGVVELVGSFNPAVVARACGGTEEGEIGISSQQIIDALSDTKAELGVGSQVVVLADLGSTMLAVSNVIEADSQVVLARGPLVEGAIAAAGEIASGSGIEEVLKAILNAAAGWVVSDEAEENEGPDPAAPRELISRNKVDAHFAADLSLRLCDFDAQVKINGADASSVLSLMRLNLEAGQMAIVEAEGPDAVAALDFVQSQL